VSLRTAFLALSIVSNLALITATVLAFLFYPTADGGIIVGAFCLTSLGISNAVLSLHFKE
jgi:hypothetical protein